jgi:hypothetical protein
MTCFTQSAPNMVPAPCSCAGDVVEGDAESITRVGDQDHNTWFMVSGEAGQQPVWIEVELPPHMRVVSHSLLSWGHQGCRGHPCLFS